MTGKERALLRKQAHELEPIINIGKDCVTPELCMAVDEALEARELIKVGVLKNCPEEPKEIADTVSGRTRSQVIQVMGRKITLYRRNPKKHRNE